MLEKLADGVQSGAGVEEKVEGLVGVGAGQPLLLEEGLGTLLILIYQVTTALLTVAPCLLASPDWRILSHPSSAPCGCHTRFAGFRLHLPRSCRPPIFPVHVMRTGFWGGGGGGQ